MRLSIRALLSALKTVLVTTDTERWRRVAAETPHWDDRNRLIAGLIPENSDVLDLGSGAQTLRAYLKSGCSYQPCDVVKSSDDVLFCDFNAAIYPNVKKIYDCVVCSGVLEYIRKPHDFLAVSSSFGKQMIVSYAPLREGDERLQRAVFGWVNHLTQPQLENLFNTLGLCWELADNWHNQIIYKIWHQE